MDELSLEKIGTADPLRCMGTPCGRCEHSTGDVTPDFPPRTHAYLSLATTYSVGRELQSSMLQADFNLYSVERVTVRTECDIRDRHVI